MSQLKLIDKEALRHAYQDEALTKEQCAELFNVSRTNIRRRLVAYNIPSRPTPYRRKGEGRRQNYVFVHLPDHPRATKNGYVPRSIIIWEIAHKQQFPEGMEPHHINGIKDDDRPENIRPMTNVAHARLPLQKKRLYRRTDE